MASKHISVRNRARRRVQNVTLGMMFLLLVGYVCWGLWRQHVKANGEGKQRQQAPLTPPRKPSWQTL